MPHNPQHHDDFATEPVPGLPEALPAGERLIWQGSPNPWRLACDAFHLRLAAAYLAAGIVVRLGVLAHRGATLSQLTAAFGGLLLPALVGLGLLYFFARAQARAAMYTITNRRVVIRSGIALTATVNLPYTRIDAAALSLGGDGTGDIALTLTSAARLPLAAVWPHARPWYWRAPQPALRAVRDAHHVAALLGDALRAACTGAARVDMPRARAAELSPAAAHRDDAFGAMGLAANAGD